MTPEQRKILLEEMNAKQEVTLVKTVDETRVGAALLPDDDLATPVLAGTYLLEISFFMIAELPTPSSGPRYEFDGPQGVEDSALGLFAQITFDNISNLAGGGFQQPVGVATSGVLVVTNGTGFFRFRQPGDLTLTWGQIVFTAPGTTLLQGSMMHLRRASNGIGRPP